MKESRGLDAVKNLSLDVRAGEVVGIAGIDGNGQTELIQALAGLTKVENGSIHLNEKRLLIANLGNYGNGCRPRS